MATPAGKSKLRFGPFELDPIQRELRQGGKVVKLQQQQVSVLLLLVERAGLIVSREEIHQRIWGGDTFVDFERGINFSINQIRVALGDDAHTPTYVETVPRRGYRFVATVESADIEGASGLVSEGAGTLGHDTADIRNEGHTQSVAKLRASKRPLSLAIGSLLLALAAFLGWRAMKDHTLPSRKPENATARRLRTVPITFFSGRMGDPAFSPDGKQVAFVWDGKDHSQLNIYTLPIGGDQPYQVTHFGVAPLTEVAPALSWSPDGQFLAYARCSNDEAGVFVVPALGGPERKLTSVVCFAAFDGPPQWTPDGRAMVIADQCGTKAPFAIALVRLSLPSGRKDCLTTPPMHTFDMQFKLSPDGKKVAFVRAPTPQVGDYYVVPITGGTPLRLTRGEIQFGPLMWSPDSRRIIFYSGHQEVQGDRTVQIPAEGGDIGPELVYTTIGALSPDGQRVAYTDDSESEPRSIWRARLSAAGSRVISNEKIIDSGLFDDSPQLSPDGTRIAFVSIRSGHVQIWTSDSEGNGAVQLTSFGGEPAGSARWSPDGKLIVFDRRPGTRSQLWLMDSDGGDLHSLVSSADDSEVPSWSRDGKSIYFASRSRSGHFQLWKQRLTSDRRHPDGEPVEVTKGWGFSGFESYDGKTIYYTRWGESGIWSIPTMGGLETRVTSDPPGLWGHWAVSESGLYVLACKASSHCKLEFYRFGTRKVTSVIDVEHDLMDGDPGVSCSRDGRTVLYTRVDPQKSHIAMTELLK